MNATISMAYLRIISDVSNVNANVNDFKEMIGIIHVFKRRQMLYDGDVSSSITEITVF